MQLCVQSFLSAELLSVIWLCCFGKSINETTCFIIKMLCQVQITTYTSRLDEKDNSGQQEWGKKVDSVA